MKPAAGGSSDQGLFMLAALFGGFVFFLLLNGKLGTYWDLLTGKTVPASSPAATSQPATAASQNPVTGASIDQPQSSSGGWFSALSNIFPSLGGFLNPLNPGGFPTPLNPPGGLH